MSLDHPWYKLLTCTMNITEAFLAFADAPEHRYKYQMGFSREELADLVEIVPRVLIALFLIFFRRLPYFA